MLFIAMLFLAFLFYHSLLLFPTLVPEMLFIAILFITFLFLASLVAIFNTKEDQRIPERETVHFRALSSSQGCSAAHCVLSKPTLVL